MVCMADVQKAGERCPDAELLATAADPATGPLPRLTRLPLSPQMVRKTFESGQLEPILINAKSAGQRRKSHRCSR